MLNWRIVLRSVSEGFVHQFRVNPARSRFRTLGLLFLLTMFVNSTPSSAAEPGITRIGKASPDEFYTGLGKGYYPLGQQPPGTTGQPKVNQAWAWGMTKAGPSVWFGTAANAFSMAGTGIFGIKIPYESEFNVSEYSKSQYPGVTPFLKSNIGDWRPPHIYRYQPGHALQDVTPSDPLIPQTIGIRSAGATDEIVLLAGPSMLLLGINVFAFDAVSGAYLGSKTIIEFSDIRNWTTVDGVLYTGTLETWAKNGGGAIVRWRGTRTNPFQYEIVGRIDNEAANLVAHDGRLFALTWPVLSAMAANLLGGKVTALPAVWMSPPLPTGGLTIADQSRWQNVWTIDRYDPDPVIARASWLGGAESFDGHLVWGTIQVPGSGSEELFKEFGEPKTLGLLVESFIKGFRGVPMFRGKVSPDGVFQTELLYGDATVPVFTATGKGKGTWSTAATKAGPALLGPAGFGDPDNLYIWSMKVHEGKLYMGTFDWSFMRYGNAYVKGESVPSDMGLDLLQMTSTSTPALLVSRTGLGNVLNLGLRTMISHESGLYCGTATAANLLTDTTDTLPEGGWEVLKVDTSAISPTPLRIQPARSPLSAGEVQQFRQRWGNLSP